MVVLYGGYKCLTNLTNDSGYMFKLNASERLGFWDFVSCDTQSWKLLEFEIDAVKFEQKHSMRFCKNHTGAQH